MSIVGRLAPSPTGALHLGNARTFLIAWLSARHSHGRIILRIEDIDSPRVKPWATQATLDDLKWLNLDWDEGPDIGGAHEPYIQTANLELYHPSLQQLIDRDLVYPCTCSRSDVAASASAPHESLEGPIYGGRCSQRSAADAQSLSPSTYAWRYRATNKELVWKDLSGVEHRANPAKQLGDFIVAKGDKTPAYQLAVIVDDQRMGINQVVRGDDLVPSTFRQLDLFEALGWPAPEYLHVPLIIGTDGKRLAKRHGDSRLSWYREHGWTAERIVGFLAWTIGLIDQPESCTPRELLGCWSPLKLSRWPTVIEPLRIPK